MRYSSIPLAQTLVAHLKARDIAHIVISPGSRNAPLIISFTENPFFRCFSIVDERCAAFFALGMAQQLNRPVALICTSGSALLNYYPAVAEAFYSEIPLILISADRPGYKIDIGDGQTIRQEDVFHRHIGYSANLRQDLVHAVDRIRRYRPQWLQGDTIEALQEKVQEYNDALIGKSLEVAERERLPVHLNAPFEEPLYNFLEKPLVLPEITLSSGEITEKPSILGHAQLWNKAARKMVLVGVNAPNTLEQTVLDALGNDPSVVVFTETTSNLHQEHFFNSIDSIIAPLEISKDKEALFKDLRPEILVTFGGMVVSKKIKAFLRQYAPKHHWHIGGQRANDTFFCLTDHVRVSPNAFFSKIYADHGRAVSNYAPFWHTIKKAYRQKREEYVNKIPFSDFKVFHNILARIPTGYQLQLANSSTIRYTQLFDLDPSLTVFCNRGTSGIDGSTSTAIGASQIVDAPTVLLTGDLSFFYDSNALWNKYIKDNFRIVVVNNGGGGIFRILPGKEDTHNFETFFETRHELNAKALCSMYNIAYSSANDMENLDRAMHGFYEPAKRPRLLEIFTPRISNDKILTDYFHFISSGIINH